MIAPAPGQGLSCGMKEILKSLVVLGWIAGAHATVAATPGALESFPTVENAESWSVFDYADEVVYLPEWFDEANPYLYAFHQNDNPLWFFTDPAGSPDWLGDYDAEAIQAVRVDVFIDSLEDFAHLDCVVLTNGPAGIDYYYSELFIDTDFSEAGWWELSFNLEATWFYFDEGWNPVEMTAEDFREVEEVGFRFFPEAGTTAEVLAAIDEVRLVPLVNPPLLDYSKTADHFSLQFTPLKANTCFIEELSGGPAFAWEAVSGQTEITGPSAHTFSTPLANARGIFRVGAEPRYTQVDLD